MQSTFKYLKLKTQKIYKIFNKNKSCFEAMPKKNVTQKFKSIKKDPKLSQMINHFQQDQVVFVKLKDDNHEWPAKISYYFIQELKQINKKNHLGDDIYNPDEGPIIRKMKKIKKQGKNYELVYKVRYFEWQLYTHVNEYQIKPYTFQLQRYLLEFQQNKDKDKLQKAIKKAKLEMPIWQKQLYQKQKTSISTGKKKKNVTKRMRIKQKKSNIKQVTQQNQSIQQGQKSKQFIEKKDLQKQIVNVSSTEILNTGFQDNKLEASKICQEDTQTESLISTQINLVKEQYQEAISSELPKEKDHSFQSQFQFSEKFKDQYILNDILFKNKYQLLGIFNDLLEEFISKILWINASSVRETIESNEIQKFKNQFTTLQKILKAQIFKHQQLSDSQCFQKMLNIVRIGQLTDIQDIYKKQMLNPKNIYLKEVYKIYTQVFEQLKRIKTEMKLVKQNGHKNIVKAGPPVNICENRANNSVISPKIEKPIEQPYQIINQKEGVSYSDNQFILSYSLIDENPFQYIKPLYQSNLSKKQSNLCIDYKNTLNLSFI